MVSRIKEIIERTDKIQQTFDDINLGFDKPVHYLFHQFGLRSKPFYLNVTLTPNFNIKHFCK